MFNLTRYFIASLLLCGLDLILMTRSYKKITGNGLLFADLDCQ